MVSVVSALSGVVANGHQFIHSVSSVAVGAGVTSGPPHRSERAGLPHSALILSFGVETLPRPRMTDFGWRQPSVYVFGHSFPYQPSFLASPPERAIPGAGDFGAEAGQCVNVGRHPVVTIVTTEDGA